MELATNGVRLVSNAIRPGTGKRKPPVPQPAARQRVMNLGRPDEGHDASHSMGGQALARTLCPVT